VLCTQNGKTEYRTLTISPNATANEFMDMYLDDDNRPNWVSGCDVVVANGQSGPFLYNP
jgi:hypothetical protein